MPSGKDLTNMRFGRLVVLERAEDQITNKGYHNKMWLCKCDCGNTIITRGKSLMYGDTKSCGCLMKELLSQRAGKHHKYGIRLYAIWNSMRQRCNNPNCHAYSNYGARGIKITPKWDDFQVFYEWAQNNGYDENAVQGKCTLDRINVDGNYEPDNCRWITIKEQANNKQNTVNLTYNEETHALSEWANILNIKYQTLWRRYRKGWDTEKILTTPVK